MKSYKRLAAPVITILCCLSLAVGQAAAARAQTQADYYRLERVAGLIRGGELGGAERELGAVLRARPADANALNLLGVVRAKQGKAKEAEELFLRALKSSPALVGAYVNLGQLYLDGRQDDRALWAFGEALKLAPERPDINFQVASLLAGRGEYAPALSHLERVPGDPSDFDYLALLVKCQLGLGRREAALALVKRVTQTGAAPAEALSRLAATLTGFGLAGEAVQILEAARRRQPDSPLILYHLGAAYEAAGEPGRAEESYAAADELSHESVPVLRALARLASARGEHEKALAHLIRARKLAPDSPQVLYDFGWTALNLNLLYDALPVLERLHRTKAEEPTYLYALAIARLHNQEGERALELISRYVRLRPRDARGHYVLGAALYSLKRYEAARLALQRSEELTPYADAEYYLGLAAREEGYPERAAEWFRRAVKSDPAHSAAHAELGVLSLAQRDYDAARKSLERAVAINPRDVKAHYQLGIVYGRLGDRARSQAMFELSRQLRAEERKREVVGFKLVDPPK
ncbi:MAG TPA: tetratricopeptide repeat protein [Pyrinomonadaceae bacterium]|jgi:tetratricopeptide (TPR) repeat protein